MVKPSSVADNTVVGIHYRLTLDDGREVDTSRGGDPLFYLHGHANIVPGLERQMTGRAAGDRFVADVPAAEGYGEHDPARIQELDRGQFPADLELAPGMHMQAQDGDGNQIPFTVQAVSAGTVQIDLNHPLAGETLHFDIEVVAVRAATAEELEHGHVHGPGGAH